MSPAQRNRIKRLNVLLQFAQLNLKEFSNGELESLRRDLVYAIYDRRNLTPADEPFMKLGAIYETHNVLLGAILELKRHGSTTLRLSAQDVTFAAKQGGTFGHLFDPDDFHTAACGSLVYLLEKSEIVREQLLDCANPKCQKVFVPIRKPAKNKRAYCSTGCARLVAVQDYRKRKGAELKQKEQKRSKQRYRKKILKM
jgi:CGNR zinc finger